MTRAKERRNRIAAIKGNLTKFGGGDREIPQHCDFCSRPMEILSGRPIAKAMIKLCLGSLDIAVLYAGKCCREDLRLNLRNFAGRHDNARQKARILSLLSI